MEKTLKQSATWIWFAWAVAMAATLGSLYFSEIKGWVPCELCWYQRIAMYPMAVILLIAALKNDTKIYQYVFPVIMIGGLISVYHYLLQWGVFSETCGINAVSCAYVPNMWFGFVTLPLLALVAFKLIGWCLYYAKKLDSK